MRLSGKLKSLSALAASLVVVVGLSACGGDNGGNTGGKSNADLLKDAAKNMRELKSYRIDADVTSGEQQTKIEGDVDLANNKHNLKVTTQGTDMTMVNVGDDYWFSTDGGQNFTAVPAEQTGIFATSFKAFDEMWTKTTDAEIDQAASKLKDGDPATEKIDGADTKHMVAGMADLASLGSTATGGQGTVEGNVDLWVDTGTPAYVRQMKIDGKSDGEDVKGTIKWSNLNQPVEINPPK